MLGFNELIKHRAPRQTKRCAYCPEICVCVWAIAELHINAQYALFINKVNKFQLVVCVFALVKSGARAIPANRGLQYFYYLLLPNHDCLKSFLN